MATAAPRAEARPATPLFSLIVVLGIAAAGAIASPPAPAAPPPRADSFDELPRLSVDRSDPMVFALSDGRAVVAGGERDDGGLVAACEILDRGTWRPYPPLPVPIHGGYAATLADDVLLIAGGTTDSGLSDRAYISDARHGSHAWRPVECRLPFPITIGHEQHLGMHLLADGSVLLTSGTGLDVNLEPSPDIGLPMQAIDVALIFRPDRSRPERGTFDLTRDWRRPPVPVRSGRGDSIELTWVHAPSDGIPKVALLRDEAGRFRPEDQGQPIAIAGSEGGNDTPLGRTFYVFKYISPKEAMYWNPGARRERTFRGTWTVGGRRPETRCPRRYASLPVRLESGRVFRFGGVGRYGEPARADWDIYDPQTGRWTLHDGPDELCPPVSGEVVLAGDGDRIGNRGEGIAVLRDGSVDFRSVELPFLITIEGATSAANDGTFLAVELEDRHTVVYENPSAVRERFAGLWQVNDGEDPPGARSGGRDHAAAALLPDGSVLVAGGLTSFSHLPRNLRRSCFIIDPDRPGATFRPTASKPLYRHYSKPFTLPGGEIGLALGYGGESPFDECGSRALVPTEIFDPRAERWRLGAPAPTRPVVIDGVACDLPVADNGFGSVTRLATGEILLAGGHDPTDPEGLRYAGVLIYRPGCGR